MRRNALALAVLGGLTLAPEIALAISDDEMNRTLQFNFSNPGARSLGLGGAFTGLADDATASYANPAGLTSLRKVEFGLEARSTQFDTPYASGGTLLIDPYDDSDIGEDSSSDSVANVSFASIVYPTERATFSLFYHRVGDFEGSSAADTIFYADNLGLLGDFVPAVGNIRYEVENFGAAVGFAVSDTFSLGGAIAYSDFTISSRADRGEGDDATVQRQRGSDDDIVFTLGALWQITPQWNLGLAYRSGGDFRYSSSNEVTDTGERLELRPEFAVPNVFSAGLAFRPTDAWLLSLDVNRVEYSRLSDNVESIFGLDGGSLGIDDATEIRFGAEYAFLEMATPMFLRGGIWHDPDHRLSIEAPPADCFENLDGCILAALYPEGDDETHYSLGIGWSFTSFQLDFAADFSDAVDTYSASGVMRF